MSGGNDTAAPDFAALYRELGVDATCSPVELRHAWRRRVAKLHPDLGGSAEDTGRLQELNRLYDAAVDFRTRFGRLPGAATVGTIGAAAHRMGSGADDPSAAEGDPEDALAADDSRLGMAWQRADRTRMPQSSAGFGRISRWFVVVSLCAIAVLGWRVLGLSGADSSLTEPAQAHSKTPGASAQAGDGAMDKTIYDDAREAFTPTAARTDVGAVDRIAPGVDQDTVRDILGDPLDMHALRWQYGPSWVDFHCDKVVDWYSSPLRPLPVASERAPQTDPSTAADRGCD